MKEKDYNQVGVLLRKKEQYKENIKELKKYKDQKEPINHIGFLNYSSLSVAYLLQHERDAIYDIIINRLEVEYAQACNKLIDLGVKE